MSLFKKKESSFEDMDSQGQLKRIMEQLGFLEKKVDTVLEELRNRGASRPSFGGGQGGPRGFNRDRGGDRGGFRPNNNRPRPEGGSSNGGNTRYAGQGPRRYSPGRPFGNDENRGNYSGGNNRHEGNRGPRPNNNRRPQYNQGAPSPAAPQAAASQEAQPE